MPREAKVSYFYDPECFTTETHKYGPTAVYYGYRHPMKPHRIGMTHSLLMNSAFWPSLHIKQAAPIKEEVIKQFCTDGYYKFLSKSRTFTQWDALESVVREGNAHQHAEAADLERCGIMDDCPIFETIFDFSKSAAAMSIGAAVMLNHGLSDVAVNWAGGLHHARIDRAEGFCYINDIVLGILELLKYHARVLYVDIDIHHGDGVEEAFLNTNRVMTVSFHKFDRGDKHRDDFFFPGTGDVCDIGPDGNHPAKGYAVNVPLHDGLSDDMFLEGLFVPVIEEVMLRYSPQVVVLQSGADSVASDKIGKFNLSTVGHASAGRWLRTHYPHVPVMVLGGGGYTISNVARTWSYETISMLGFQDADIPHLCPLDAFHWEHIKQELSYPPGAVPYRVPATNMDNKNTPVRLSRLVANIKQNLQEYVHPVSVPFEAVNGDAIRDPAELNAAKPEGDFEMLGDL